MKNFFKGHLLIGVLAGLLIGGGWLAYAAISQQVGINGLDTNGIWQPLKTAANSDAILNNNFLATSLYGFNGATYDRIRSGINSDATANTGFLVTSLYGWNNATWDRIHSSLSADALGATGFLNNTQFIFNGATYDRIRSASTTNLTAANTTGVLSTHETANVSCTSTPAAGAQATCSIAAGAGTVRHVAESVTACLNDTAAATGTQTVNLRDGGTGAGTILWSALLAIPVAGDSKCISMQIPMKPGSATTALTLEFAAAGAATSNQSVTLTAINIQ